MALVSTVAEAAIAPRDDLGLHQQALRARVDQSGAELRQVEDAREHREQADQIQRNDAAGEAGEGQRDEVAAGALEQIERTAPAAARLLGRRGPLVRHRSKRRRAEFGIVVAIMLRSIKQWLNRSLFPTRPL